MSGTHNVESLTGQLPCESGQSRAVQHHHNLGNGRPVVAVGIPAGSRTKASCCRRVYSCLAIPCITAGVLLAPGASQAFAWSLPPSAQLRLAKGKAGTASVQPKDSKTRFPIPRSPRRRLGISRPAEMSTTFCRASDAFPRRPLLIAAQPRKTQPPSVAYRLSFVVVK